MRRRKTSAEWLIVRSVLQKDKQAPSLWLDYNNLNSKCTPLATRQLLVFLGCGIDTLKSLLCLFSLSGSELPFHYSFSNFTYKSFSECRTYHSVDMLLFILKSVYKLCYIITFTALCTKCSTANKMKINVYKY